MLGITDERFYKGGLETTRQVIFQNYVAARRSYLVCKRIFDIVFSLFVIVFLLSWLLPILALLIKLDSRGPVFFVQERVGFLGKVFRCFKFRTMIVNENSDDQQ